MGCICETLAKPEMSLSNTCIGHLWLFADLGAAEQQAIAENAIRSVYQPGEIIFHQGDPADRMFLIKAGRVKLTKVTEAGAEMTLDIRKEGDFVGESIFGEESAAKDYPMTTTCMAPTLICGFSQAAFEGLILDHPAIGLQVIRNLSRRIEWLTSRVGTMAATNLEDRLYRVLVQVAREHGVADDAGAKIQFPLTHEDLSFLAGAHRVSVTRAMKALRETGRVIQDGRTLIIPALRLDESSASVAF